MRPSRVTNHAKPRLPLRRHRRTAVAQCQRSIPGVASLHCTNKAITRARKFNGYANNARAMAVGGYDLNRLRVGVCHDDQCNHEDSNCDQILRFSRLIGQWQVICLPMASQWRGTLLPVHTGTIGSHVRQSIARRGRGKVAAEPERPSDLLGDQRKLCCQSSIVRDPVDYRSYRHPEPGAYHIRMAHTVRRQVVTSRQCFAFNAPLLAEMIATSTDIDLHKLAPAHTPGDSSSLCAISMTRSDDVLF